MSTRRGVTMQCGICGGGFGATWETREMMFGTLEPFTYGECSECGCLQITDEVPDLGRYYGDDYYSVGRENPLLRVAKEARLNYLASGRGLLGRLVATRMPRERDESVAPSWLSKDAAALEVGCGNGYYLLRLFELGYTRLWGVDPFMDDQALRTTPVRLERRSILDVDPAEGPVDVVMFHHSLEHIAEQHATLERARQLLAPGGLCVVAIPTVSSWAWEHYRGDWAQLDAPRHLYLHSRESIARLARDHGFAVEKIVDDSTAFQFWGSEQYRRGVPLCSASSFAVDPRCSAFTAEQISGFDEQAADLNRQGRGDQFEAHLRADD